MPATTRHAPARRISYRPHKRGGVTQEDDTQECHCHFLVRCKAWERAPAFSLEGFRYMPPMRQAVCCEQGHVFRVCGGARGDSEMMPQQDERRRTDNEDQRSCGEAWEEHHEESSDSEHWQQQRRNDKEQHMRGTFRTVTHCRKPFLTFARGDLYEFNVFCDKRMPEEEDGEASQGLCLPRILHLNNAYTERPLLTATFIRQPEDSTHLRPWQQSSCAARLEASGSAPAPGVKTRRSRVQQSCSGDGVEAHSALGFGVVHGGARAGDDRLKALGGVARQGVQVLCEHALSVGEEGSDGDSAQGA